MVKILIGTLAYGDHGAINCLQCPVGTYADTKGSYIYFSEVNLDTWALTTSDDYRYFACKTCPIGKYNDNTGSKADTSCKTCPGGRYGDREKIGVTASESDCLNCSAGRYSEAEDSLRTCWQCPAGYYSEQENDACPACEDGMTSDVESDLAGCKNCEAGQFEEERLCVNCAIGRYTDQVKQTECKNCTIGRYQHQEGQTLCLFCADGYTNDDVTIGPVLENDWGFESFSYSDGTANRFRYQQITRICDIICLEGYYSVDGSGCLQCPVGYYQNDIGMSECKSCEAGKYNDQTGQSTCDFCPDGQYNSEQNGECKECPAGYYKDNQNNQCNVCDSGKYSSQGASTCSLCPKGKYLTSTANDDISDCEDCPVGRFNSNEGNDECTLCIRGYYSDSSGQSSCTACEFGKYNGQQEQSTCDSCPAGQYKEIIPRGYCDDWNGITNQGWYYAIDNTYAPKGSFQCDAPYVENCRTGYGCFCSLPFSLCGDQDWNGGTRDNAQQYRETVIHSIEYYHEYIIAHSEPQFQWKSYCTDCPAGKYSLLDSTPYECINCPTGFYSDDKGKNECEQCPSGKSSKPNSNKCDAITDMIADEHSGECEYDSWTLLALQQKSMSDTCGDNLTVVENLVQCPGGEYYDGECRPCPAGSFSSDNDYGCRFCPMGRSSPEGSDDETDCIPCEVDFISFERVSNIGQASKICGCGSGKYFDNNTCFECDAGYGYNPSAYGKDECEPCPVGQISEKGGRCSSCPAGQFQNEEGQASCKSCLPQVSSRDRTGCEDCSPGTFRSSGECFICPFGEYQPQQNQNGCILCEAGKYSDSSGSALCKSCPDGKVNNKRGQTSQGACEDCSSGFFASDDHITCQPCVDGTYKDNKEDVHCTACPNGFKSETDKTSCIECQPGTFYDGLTCVDCPSGFYTDETKQTSCKACDEGTYQNVAAQTECKTCSLLEGQWSLAGASECSTCGVGIRPVGFSYCFRCDQGQILQSGSDTAIDNYCAACPDGKTTNGYTNVCVDIADGQLKFNESATYTIQGHAIQQRINKVGYCPVGMRISSTNTTCEPCANGQTAGLNYVYVTENCPNNPAEWKDAYNNACDWYESEGYCRNGMPTDKEIDVSGLNMGGLNINRQQMDAHRYNKLIVDNVLACGLDNIGCSNSGAYENCDICNMFTKCQPQTEVSSNVLPTSFNIFNTECTSCPDGMKLVNNVCSPCYHESGDSECSQCPKGMYHNDNFGCLNCPKGYFQNETNKQSCKACPAGSGQTFGATSENECGECPSGFFADNGQVDFLRNEVIDVDKIIEPQNAAFNVQLDGFQPNAQYIIESWTSNRHVQYLNISDIQLGTCATSSCTQQTCYHNKATYANQYVVSTSTGTLSVQGQLADDTSCAARLTASFKLILSTDTDTYFVPHSYAESQGEEWYGCQRCPIGTTSEKGSPRCHFE